MADNVLFLNLRRRLTILKLLSKNSEQISYINNLLTDLDIRHSEGRPLSDIEFEVEEMEV